MKIAVVTPVYALAGVPLAQVRLARSLSSRGYNVHLLIGRILSGYEFLPPPSTKTTIFNRASVLQMFIPLLHYLRTERPAVIFSAEDHLNVVVLAAVILSGSKAKVSCSSRVTPYDTFSSTKFTKPWILKWLYRLTMHRADVLSCVSQDMLLQYKHVFPNAPFQCIYNIVVSPTAQSLMREPVDHPWLYLQGIPLLVAAGRLAQWKGFLDLIEAVSLVLPQRQIRLLILGDGPMRSLLAERIRFLGLNDVVHLLGYVDNPLKYFSRADIFVLSSHVEGLPNVLVEAMMCGCTPVATDCPTGPREVLADGKFGYLVNPRDPLSLSKGILKALDHRIPLKHLNSAIQPFEENAVIVRHFSLLGLPVVGNDEVFTR